MRYTIPMRAVALATPVLLVAMSATAQAQTTRASQASQTVSSQTAGGLAALSPGQAQALSKNVSDKVIIVMRDQVTSLPDTAANAARRTAAVTALQHGVLSQLAATHARNVRSISLVNAVAATVSPGEAKLLASSPAVAEVVPDLPIPVAATPPVLTKTGPAPAAGIKPLPGACLANGRVQLNPEAIENIHAASQSGKGRTAQALGYTGAGVKVAYIADGIDPDNPDFIRANGKHVFVDYQDFSGTGTSAQQDGGEAFLDASSIAAQGRHVYNVAGYGVGLDQACKIRILGVAPGASLVGLNVFGSANVAFNSVFLRAISYAVSTDHVNVINESFGSNVFPDVASLDLTELADNAAIRAGVTVTVSSGDAGPTDTIGSPATDPKVISAGASTTYRAYAQTGIGGITEPGVKGWIDNNISGLSSGGFAESGGTVDVVAPGDLNWALCTAKAMFADCTNFADAPAAEQLSGGTSEASPLTAGVAALVIQAYAKAHHGHRPSPAVVKRIIVSTAQDISAPAEQQGAGMIDAYQAVLAAASYHRSGRARAGHAILDSATQLNAAGKPGASRHFTETLTNDGTGSVTVGLSTRTLAPYRAIDTRSLKLTKGQGFTKSVTFRVAPGQARLDASVALVGVVNLSLIAPDGDLAEYNLPQGIGNYGNAQVARPAAGRWTALIASDSGGAPIHAHFQASTATWRKLGTLSASSVRIPAGGSRTVRLTTSIPAHPGDTAGAIVLRNSAATPAFGRVTTIPVTVRSLIPAPHPATSFTGSLTGGNGRDTNTGQTAYYQMTLPAGLRALNVSVSTGNAANTLLAELVSPSGEAASSAINGLTASGSATQPEKGAQLHVLHPAAGRWTLVIDFFNTVSGTAIAQPVSVRINDIPVPATAPGLPDSASTRLAPGTPVTFDLHVTNNGQVPEAYFVDARLSSKVNLSLATQSTSTLTLPNVNGVTPAYLVPTHTTALSAKVTAAKSLYFDFSWPFGDPDVISSAGTTARGSLAAPAVAAGDWTVTPFLTGPTGVKAASPVQATVSMTATTAAFDPAVSAGTGDLWLGSTNATAPFTPVVVDPGHSAVIPVTFTPQGPAGSTVSGTLYLDDSSLIPGGVTYNSLSGNFPEGSDLAAFGYQYTIK
jgi:hypothetical protein